ncbi:uncharacterized protein Z519_12398 [Cladophialophora bantiana CBS 173.52]|uniref:Coenzyme Q-binding protein COQ10 START domain-containing protein n=1 Tax=Cladophialophora bantiana (strain ATCC 10958 / CBS 173.52 / CDC B-1940 / NIH 8579) TaxID=1442370 RepID=A0A0D2H0Z2_CLAB1|nr:uncharacterized protein Z519_12398 [Cladophialophora bantiana CBS 173.52]KIW86933.1 hypothetical protein Z519_12398 [Cladophialophora bantiana CBS 173.52]
MPSVYSSLRLPAPPQQIWDILTDFEHYSEWNPVIQSISGEQCTNGRLHLQMKNPRTSKVRKSDPIIKNWSPVCHLHWRARPFDLPGLFTEYHHFILQPSADGMSTDFEHFELFSGIFAYLIKYFRKIKYSDREDAFNAMNDALKKRAGHPRK